MTPVLTIQVKADGIWVSPMSRPKEPINYGDDQYYGCRMDKYQLALKSYEASFVKVQNREVLGKFIPMTLETKQCFKEGTYPAPKGLVMEVTCKWKGNRNACGNEYCWDLGECQKNPAVCICSIEEEAKPEKEENKGLWQVSRSEANGISIYKDGNEVKIQGRYFYAEPLSDEQISKLKEAINKFIESL